MFNTLRTWIKPANPKRKGGKPTRSTRLQVENLEERRVLNNTFQVYRNLTPDLEAISNGLSEPNPVLNSNYYYSADASKIKVVVRSTGANFGTIMSQLQGVGFQSTLSSASAKTAVGFLPIDKIDDAAQVSSQPAIDVVRKPIRKSRGTWVNSAESAMRADLASNAYGLNGAGIKIGIISDSINQGTNVNGGVFNGLYDSIQTGDLPSNITVLQDGLPGSSDEGRAMAELIYDIAPGAQLFFHSTLR